MINGSLTIPRNSYRHILFHFQIFLKSIGKSRLSFFVVAISQCTGRNQYFILRTTTVVITFFETVHAELIRTTGYHSQYITSHFITVFFICCFCQLFSTHSIHSSYK